MRYVISAILVCTLFCFAKANAALIYSETDSSQIIGASGLFLEANNSKTEYKLTLYESSCTDFFETCNPSTVFPVNNPDDVNTLLARLNELLGKTDYFFGTRRQATESSGAFLFVPWSVDDNESVMYQVGKFGVNPLSLLEVFGSFSAPTFNATDNQSVVFGVFTPLVDNDPEKLPEPNTGFLLGLVLIGFLLKYRRFS